jgi:hypothetical protein
MSHAESGADPHDRRDGSTDVNTGEQEVGNLGQRDEVADVS